MRARLVETLVDLRNAPPPPLVNATDADALPPPPPTALPASAGAPERDANADSEAALMMAEGGAAVYLSFMSVLSQVFLVLSQAFLGFISGFSPR